MATTLGKEDAVKEQDRLTLTPPTKLVQLLDLQDMGE